MQRSKPRGRLIFPMLTIAGMILAGTVLAGLILAGKVAVEFLSASDKSAFAVELTSGCAAKLRLGHDEQGRPYDPPFTEQEISNYCECAGSSMADLITREEYGVMHDKHAPTRLMASILEKGRCIVVEKCKKHLNLAHPEKFQYEQCWKG